MSADDTIFAVASGAGVAALSIIRVSGLQAKVILETLTGWCSAPRKHSLTKILDPESGELIDQCVAVWLPGPNTYTGEDSVEFYVHAGRATVAAVLSALSRLPSCRLADPGEFTRRAVLNGKMDLVEAEGLGDLLVAETARQRRQALGLMLGQASSVFEEWRKDLILIRSDIEAVLDFSEEAGVAEEASVRIDDKIRRLIDAMETELSRATTARAIRDGVKVVLAGLPNTGKSSILNAIVGRDAAIVSALPGTTRDVIEVRLDLAGIPVLLMDTAGLRSSEDEIEREGIRRGKDRISEADVTVWVMAPDVAGSDIVFPGVTPDIVVMGKSDLWDKSKVLPCDIGVSPATSIGLEGLLEALTRLVEQRFALHEGSVVVSARQQALLTTSIRFLNEALAIASDRLELKAFYLQRAQDEVGRITGRVDVEEWLGAIFSRFCIGK